MSIYQHFREEERVFIDHVLEWKETVKSQFSPKLTDFLDPREQEIIKNIIGLDEEIHLTFFGGSENAERKRALIYPDYYVPDEEDYQLTLYEVEYAHKFIRIEHPQVLGSLMAIGIKRGKFGDIFIQHERVQFVVAREVALFVEANLQSIGKAKVSLKQQTFREVVQIIQEWDEVNCTVSSMRLDVVIAEAFHISRSKAVPFIQGGVTKVNWKLVEQTSFECKAGDMISVRGQGRIKIIRIDGVTKREKIKLTIGKNK